MFKIFTSEPEMGKTFYLGLEAIILKSVWLIIIMKCAKIKSTCTLQIMLLYDSCLIDSERLLAWYCKATKFTPEERHKFRGDAKSETSFQVKNLSAFKTSKFNLVRNRIKIF